MQYNNGYYGGWGFAPPMQLYNGQWMTQEQKIAMVQQQVMVAAQRWRMLQYQQEQEMRRRIQEQQRGNGLLPYPPTIVLPHPPSYRQPGPAVRPHPPRPPGPAVLPQPHPPPPRPPRPPGPAVLPQPHPPPPRPPRPAVRPQPHPLPPPPPVPVVCPQPRPPPLLPPVPGPIQAKYIKDNVTVITGNDSLQKKEGNPSPLSKKPNHIGQLEKFWNTLWELINALAKHDGEQGTMKLAELKKLYKEVIDTEVKDEIVDSLPLKIIGYMQTSGIGGTGYSLWRVEWMVCHILAEVNFSKDSLSELWESWFCWKYKALVTECDEDDIRFPELILMTKLLGHVYKSVSSYEDDGDIASEITSIGEKKYGSAWVRLIRPFTKFPGPVERVGYIVGENRNSKERTKSATSSLPEPPTDIDPLPPVPEEEDYSPKMKLRPRTNLSKSLPTKHQSNSLQSVNKKKRCEEAHEKDKSENKSKSKSSRVNVPERRQGMRTRINKGPNNNTSTAWTTEESPSSTDKGIIKTETEEPNLH